MSDTELPLSDSPSLIKKENVEAKEVNYFTFILTISSVFNERKRKTRRKFRGLLNVQGDAYAKDI